MICTVVAAGVSLAGATAGAATDAPANPKISAPEAQTTAAPRPTHRNVTTFTSPPCTSKSPIESVGKSTIRLIVPIGNRNMQLAGRRQIGQDLDDSPSPITSSSRPSTVDPNVPHGVFVATGEADVLTASRNRL